MTLHAVDPDNGQSIGDPVRFDALSQLFPDRPDGSRASCSLQSNSLRHDPETGFLFATAWVYYSGDDDELTYVIKLDPATGQISCDPASRSFDSEVWNRGGQWYCTEVARIQQREEYDLYRTSVYAFDPATGIRGALAFSVTSDGYWESWGHDPATDKTYAINRHPEPFSMDEDASQLGVYDWASQQFSALPKTTGVETFALVR